MFIRLALLSLIILALPLGAGRVAGQTRKEDPPKSSTSVKRPFLSPLITRWGEAVKAGNVWVEYPRPQMERSAWTNLNGMWEYAVTTRSQKELPSKWDGKILVPFCLESKLGGVQRMLQPTETLWYRCAFRAKTSDKQRMILHFEAVDYRCEVFVNGKLVGKHVGGNTPFEFDISAYLQDGENVIVVRVEDDTEGWQLRGKQTLNPRGIWYTQVSGIYQTVWYENVPMQYIADLKIHTDAASGTIRVRAKLAGTGAAKNLRIVAKDGNKAVAETTAPADDVVIKINDAKLWSPTSPHLYNLEIALLDERNQPVDRVRSYAGIRTVGKARDKDGHLRFTLNGQEIFHFGPLDQGWWPDGLLTPPSDNALKSDIEFLKSAGFNMIRKHIKVEPRRFYYHCDRMGMMVWQDQVSAGNNPKWTRLKPNPKDADWPDEHHRQWMLEFERMIDTLESHPCIVMWVPFNEAWGQHRTMEVGKWAVKRDPTRLINIASGGNFWPIGDVVDAHSYPHPDFPFNNKRDEGYVRVIGEFGGHGWPVQGHLWDPNRKNWGYGDLPKSIEEYRQRYARSIELLNELRKKGIAAGVYTQTTDVEGEINGLLTYDRKVAKIEPAELARLHKILFAP
jgi:beta-galactosidase